MRLRWRFFFGKEVGFQNLAFMPLPDLHFLPEHMDLIWRRRCRVCRAAPGRFGLGFALGNSGFGNDFLLGELPLSHKSLGRLNGRKAGEIDTGEPRLDVFGFRAIDLARKAVNVARDINHDKGRLSPRASIKPASPSAFDEIRVSARGRR